MSPKEESPIPPKQMWPELRNKLDLFGAEKILEETPDKDLIPLKEALAEEEDEEKN